MSAGAEPAPSAGFTVVDATTWIALAPEQMGSKVKQWLEDPAGDRWLFKAVRAKSDASGTLRLFGEDWSEKVARELGLLLGVPVPEVELARRGAARGVVVRTVLPDDRHTFAPGNELLQRADPSYDKDRSREVPGYTMAAVWEALDGHRAPPGADDPLTAATDVFAGYLLFDALIANTDRNHENWAVVVPPEGDAWLAPSYDHATSLGFQEPTSRKAQWLAGDALQVGRWVERGRSSHFERKPHLVDLAAGAMQRVPRAVSRHWRQRLTSLTESAVSATIDAVPAGLLSQADRTFAFQIVRLNRERLLRACWAD